MRIRKQHLPGAHHFLNMRRCIGQPKAGALCGCGESQKAVRVSNEVGDIGRGRLSYPKGTTSMLKNQTIDMDHMLEYTDGGSDTKQESDVLYLRTGQFVSSLGLGKGVGGTSGI